VTCKNNMEVQIDIVTGVVLQTAYRRSDMLNAIHEGAFFGSPVKWYLFFPASIALLFLWFTGLIMFAARFKRRKRVNAASLQNDQQLPVVSD
jgi:uncharacterized iron-regulated membrane protein